MSPSPAAASDDSTFWQVLSSRRMCRDFADTPVDAALLARVTAAAFRGPAAGNAHALDLVVKTTGVLKTGN